MSRIRGRDTGPEIRLRKALWAMGYRYRTDHRCLGVKVDIAMPGRRIAIFVDGCFWHGCPYHAVRPKSNRSFWSRKLTANKSRDVRQSRMMRSKGWTVIRVWEHAVEKDAVALAASLATRLGVPHSTT